ncbi:MAG: AMP-binding protein [Deltaproteobacteria bacterium]|nr:AMP-binding protein [Deltaproteobacteria bacterium]
MSLATLFERTAARYADQIAVIDGDRRLTFADLYAVAAAAAAELVELGVRPGEIVAYQLPNWWEAVVVFLAAIRAGATVNPLLPIFRETELRFTLRQSGASVLFMPGIYRGCDHPALIASLRADLPSLRHVFVVRDTPSASCASFRSLPSGRPTTPDAQRPTSDEPAGQIAADAIALLMYTSGTTAAPKGVLHTHNSLAAEVMSLARVHRLTSRDRTLMPSPLTHISGVIHAILAPALLGTSAVLMERWQAEEAVRLIASERVTYMVGAPTFLQDIVAQLGPHPRSPSPTREEENTATFDVSSLRLFSCGGASVSPSLVQQARALLPGCVTKRVYGSTEFPTLTTTSAADAVARGVDSEGRAIAPAEVRIVDPDGRTLAYGHEGEVQGRGPECFAGYLDATLNADSFSADGWFRSGDLGVLDAEGYLQITGRLKDIVIRKGEKISVKEVEDAVAAHPAVVEVVVVALPDPLSGERACAVVRLRGGARLDLAGLQEFLSARQLAKQKWPEELRIVDQFPRTESGKIVRTRVKEQLGGA